MGKMRGREGGGGKRESLFSSYLHILRIIFVLFLAHTYLLKVSHSFIHSFSLLLFLPTCMRARCVPEKLKSEDFAILPKQISKEANECT